VHDLAHPGVNNAFLVRTRAPTAVTYNDRRYACTGGGGGRGGGMYAACCVGHVQCSMLFALCAPLLCPALLVVSC
jgi:hypothetical protein